MAFTNNNTPLLHRKEWQMMAPAPVVTAAGMCVISDKQGSDNIAMYVTSSTVQYLYHYDEDAYTQIPSAALAGTFGAGVCGEFHPWSIPYTANGGSTTTIQCAINTHNLTGQVRNSTVRVLTGANAGYEGTVSAILTTGTAGTNVTLTVTPAMTNAMGVGDTFKISTGRFYVMGAGSVAAGIFKVFDMGTQEWKASLTTTGLPATWGTDGGMCTPYTISGIFANGTATSATGTTLVNSAKTWTTNQWINYQVRITGGTGIGQTRLITANDGTSLTVATWTATPDATSTYAIEGDENSIFLSGNNAVTMYKYSISGNTWATVAPTTARAAAGGTGTSLDWCSVTGDAGWANESAILDGQYIYSLRGSSSGVIDRFKISGGTSGAGAWEAVNTSSVTETFTTGSSAFIFGRYIYIRKDATNRFFKFAIRGNYLEALNTNMYTDGTALLGQKLWVKSLDSTNTVTWLYSLQNTGTALHRLLLF